MIYEPDRVVQDFARRTYTNLVVIRRLREEGESVYEVTQFVNSLLGLLVFPKERFFQSIPTINRGQLIQDGWPIERENPLLEQSSNLRDFVRRLRNGIVHFRMEFLSIYPNVSDESPEINGLRIYDSRNRIDKVWEVVFSLHDLEIITQKLLEIMLQIPVAEGVPLGESAASGGSS